jgi:hypothetical protein
MTIEFTSVLKQAPGMTATGIPVPDDIVAQLGGAKNAAVTVTVRKAGGGGEPYGYAISIGNRGGVYLLAFSSAHRAASGLVADDPLEVTIALDTTPRTVVVPDDLAAALAAAGLTDTFSAASYTKQKTYADSVAGAKAAETRARRVEKAIADLRG